MSITVDVHTHMISHGWLNSLREHGGPRYEVKPAGGIPDVIHLDGSAFMTPLPPMFDWDLRVKNMSNAGVDISVVSLTCPNVFWGGEEVSLANSIQINDDFASAQTAYPDRIRWFCTLPWQYPEVACKELLRAKQLGAVGVMVLGNIDGKSLTDPHFAPIWRAIDELELPVLVHPTAPPAVGQLDMATHGLTGSIGFTLDTSLAIARCIADGFLDRYPKLKLIAGHGGGFLPYLVGRLDVCYEKIPACSSLSNDKPSNYMRRIFVDSVVYTANALRLAVDVCGSENVLFGSDYPHNIGDVAGGLARVDSLDTDVRQRIRGSNALKAFKL